MMLGVKRYDGVRATGPTDWSTGKPVVETAPIVVYGSVQPFRAHEAELLPEGVKVSDAKWIFTEFTLRTADDRAQTAADRLTIKGENFVVTSIPGDWDDVALAHTAAILVRVPPAEEEEPGDGDGDGEGDGEGEGGEE